MSARDESGFTLIELLVAMGLMLVIMTATLTSFDRFTANASRNQKLNDAQETARRAVDGVARQLRNLANPTAQGSTIDTAAAYDLIFQTSDPSRKWVRYCLNTTGAGASASGVLYKGTTTDALTATMRGACPGTGTGWVTSAVAQNVSNQYGSADRPVFSYSCPTASTAGTCSGSDYSQITIARTSLFVNTDPTLGPAELPVASSVYLRNQNEPPTASFTWARQTTGQYLLNASGSADPEGRTLRYYWFVGAGTPGTAPPDVCGPITTGTPAYIGEGVTLSYKFPAGTSSPQTITLVVKDPGCLSATSTQGVPTG